MSAPSSMWSSSCPCDKGSPYEMPTNIVIPRAPRVPTFPRPPVEEVRYDLAHATMEGLAARGYYEAEGQDAGCIYGGLGAEASAQLLEARLELMQRARRLGRG